MEGLRVKGGMTAVINMSVLRSGRIRYFLYFSTQVTQMIINLGFKSATVFCEPGRMKIQFSRDVHGKELKVWISGNRAAIELNPQLFSLVFPNLSTTLRPSLRFRKGSVSFRGNEAIIVFSSFLFKEKILESLEKKKPIGEALFYGNLRYYYGYLKFDTGIAKYLKNRGTRGAKVLVLEKKLILILENNCIVSCRECSRIDCLPFRIISNPFWQATISIYRVLKENYNIEDIIKLPFSERKGRVFLTSLPNVLLIEFPFLKGGK